MKRLALIFVSLFLYVASSFAIPSGTYVDSRGGNKVLVATNGKDVYFLDNSGNVTKHLVVVKENSDGSFELKDDNGLTYSKNAWWSEDGKTYLNLQHKLRTLEKQ